MTPTDRHTIRVSTPADLLALVPYLIGFQIPTPSLVVIALTNGRLRAAARIDLPVSPAGVPALSTPLSRLARTLATDGATQAMLVGYGTAAQVDPTIQAATTALHAVELPVTEALRVAGGRFYSLTCHDPYCCPPDGTPFDPSASIAAASATVAGMVALPSRDALAATLNPVTGPARAAMEAATVTAAESLITWVESAAPGLDDPDTSPNTPLGRDLLHAGRSHLDRAQRHYEAGDQLGDQETALLTLLLELPSVRELAARRTTGALWEVQMWTDLVRRAQPDLSAAPATLLALAALQAGNGPLANIAVQRALQIDPTDRVARTLEQAVAAGVDPATAAALLAD